jgi:hypothetical protein
LLGFWRIILFILCHLTYFNIILNIRWSKLRLILRFIAEANLVLYVIIIYLAVKLLLSDYLWWMMIDLFVFFIYIICFIHFFLRKLIKTFYLWTTKSIIWAMETSHITNKIRIVSLMTTKSTTTFLTNI